jgi:hypothetical protein
MSAAHGVGVARVVGEVGERPAEFGVGGVAEADCAVFARLEGDRAGAGRGGEGVGGGIAAAGVADLGQQCGGADLAGAGQAGEDRRVGVQGECFFDPAGELGGLVLDGVDGGQQRQGDVPARVGLDAGQSGWSGA